MKIVVACDKFKGSLSSSEVADSIERVAKAVFPSGEILKVPVADGGEGTVESIMAVAGGRRVTIPVHDPLMNCIMARYGILPDNCTAVIEMSAACGLSLVPLDRRNPCKTTTYGTGEMIADALTKGCRHFILGIGGSATNDAGTGILQALGVKFFDAENKLLKQGAEILDDISRIDMSGLSPAVKSSHFTVICDVANPLYGPDGAAYVFASQKGASPDVIEQLDKGLRNFAEQVFMATGRQIADIPGSGAAGGVGGGLLGFLNAELKSGIQTILDKIDFDSKIRDADVIITGEGSMDSQTVMGKTPYGILLRAQKQNIPVIAVCGSVNDVDILNGIGFQAVFPIQPGPVAPDVAMEHDFASIQVERTVRQILRLMAVFHH